MRGTVHRHIRGNVVGYLALFLILSTGTAYAVDGPLAGQNTVGSEDIIGDEVKSGDIADGRIFNLDIADDVIESGKIKDGTLSGADAFNGSITDLDIATATLFNGSLTTADIDESTLFNDNSLAAADLGTDSVNASEIATSAVASDEVTDNSLTSLDIGAGQVQFGQIAANAVRASELASVTIESAAATVAPGEQKNLTEDCGPGDVAIGGDASIGGASEAPRLLASFPVTSEFIFPAVGAEFTGWRGIFKNDDNAGDADAAVFVICLEG